jgi:hypothetical protein
MESTNSNQRNQVLVDAHHSSIHAYSYVIKQIDPNNPEVPFSFELTSNDADDYVVTNCMPPLNFEVVKALVDELNGEESSLSRFVRDMRLLFAAQLTDDAENKGGEAE